MFIPDPIIVAEKYGPTIAILCIVAAIFARYVWKKVQKLLEEHEATAKNICVHIDSIKHPEDPEKILSRGELFKEIKALRSTIEKRCGTPNCPVIPLVAQKLEGMGKELKTFCQKGEESRKQTYQLIDQIRHLVEQIFERFNGFINDLGGKMIQALERLATLRGKERNKED